MNNIRLILQILYWLVVKVWKHVVTYHFTRLIGANKALAKHMTFCKREDEVWRMTHFSVLDNLHYGSEHDVKCPHCGYETKAKRAWLRGDAWPSNLGTTYEEAKKKAEVCGHTS